MSDNKQPIVPKISVEPAKISLNWCPPIAQVREALSQPIKAKAK